MPSGFGQFGNQLTNTWGELTLARKISVIIITMIILISLLTVSFMAKKTEYQVLYSNLSQQDAAAITSKLKEQKVKYELLANASTIMVPSDLVYSLRLELAGQGLPQGGGVGFEIFDKQNFGMSEFQQKLNFQRALQGELARTISQFSEVEQARVHIVLTERSLFTEQQTEASASVVLKLKPGARLSREQIQAIVNLTAGSVEGLHAGRINVADTHGEILHGGQGESEFKQLTNSQLEYQQTLERSLEQRIESMLSKFTGPEKNIARVSAVLDFQHVEETQESFDPASTVVRSEQRSREKSEGGAMMPVGVPGVSSNMAPGQGAPNASGSSSGSSYQKQNETINYEISKVVRRVVKPIGKIKSLSVAVLVDGSYQEGSGKSKYVPRTSEEMLQIENMVKKAIGYDEKRGDQVEVANISFLSPVMLEDNYSARPDSQITDLLFSLAKKSPPIIVAILILFFIVRPFLRWLTAPRQSFKLAPGMPQTVQQLEDKISEDSLHSNTRMLSTDRAKDLVQKDSATAARLITTWLKEEE